MTIIVTAPAPSPTPFLSPTVKTEKAAARKRFEVVYTVVRDDILENFRKRNMPEEVIEYCLRVRPSTASSSAPHHQTEHGLQCPRRKAQPRPERSDSVTILKGRELTGEEYFKAAVLGWCVEWVCFSSLILV